MKEEKKKSVVITIDQDDGKIAEKFRLKREKYGFTNNASLIRYWLNREES